MKPALKKMIRNVINLLDLEIHKKHKPNINYDINLYNSLYSTDALDNKRFYNIGAGSFYHPYWTNVDFYNNWYKHEQENIGIHFDLMQCGPLPIQSDSAEIVYTSHVIEHVTDQAIRNLFNEAYRILKKDGVFRVTAPDVNLWYRAFINNDRYLFQDSIEFYSDPLVMEELEINSMREADLGSIFQYYFSATTSPLTKYNLTKKFSDEELHSLFHEKTYEDALDYICSFSKFDPTKAGYHINWVNADKVKKMLERAGFTSVMVSAYGQSVNPVLRNLSFFDNTVPEWSFYVEAIK